MENLCFLPFPNDGIPIASSQLNALIDSIEDGTIFGMRSMGLVPRIATLQTEITELTSIGAVANERVQITMVAKQGVFGLSHPPLIDSELISLNGEFLQPNDPSLGLSGDYSISGSTVTLSSTLSASIDGGELIIASYKKNV